jgi:hypothetical protein
LMCLVQVGHFSTRARCSQARLSGAATSKLSSISRFTTPTLCGA